MKAKLGYLIGILCSIFLPSIQLHGQGYIVTNGVIDLGYVDGFGYTITVIQNPTNGDYTGFTLVPQGKTPPTLYTNTFAFSFFMDEGVRVFGVSSNDSISLQPILSQSYPELGSSSIFTNGVPFYLGFYTGYSPWVVSNGVPVYTGIYSNPVFGWGEFVNNHGAIQMLASALEIEGGGIIAGTQNIIPVPEPSTLALGALGGLLLGFRRWGKMKSLLNHGMRALIVFGILLAGITKIFSQSFVNLNFESANLTGYTSGSFVPTNSAIPAWTAYISGVSQSDILFNSVPLSNAGISIFGTNGYTPLIQGHYSIILNGSYNANPNTPLYTDSAAIGQTAQIPVTAQSLIFWANISTGVPYLNNMAITFNGQNLLFSSTGSGANYLIYGADITAFAGQTGQLLFTVPYNGSVMLDNIQFSTSPVPEPSTFALAALGGLLLGFRRCQWR